MPKSPIPGQVHRARGCPEWLGSWHCTWQVPAPASWRRGDAELRTCPPGAQHQDGRQGWEGHECLTSGGGSSHEHPAGQGAAAGWGQAAAPSHLWARPLGPLSVSPLPIMTPKALPAPGLGVPPGGSSGLQKALAACLGSGEAGPLQTPHPGAVPSAGQPRAPSVPPSEASPSGGGGQRLPRVTGVTSPGTRPKKGPRHEVSGQDEVKTPRGSLSLPLIRSLLPIKDSPSLRALANLHQEKEVLVMKQEKRDKGRASTLPPARSRRPRGHPLRALLGRKWQLLRARMPGFSRQEAGAAPPLPFTGSLRAAPSRGGVLPAGTCPPHRGSRSSGRGARQLHPSQPRPPCAGEGGS